MNKIVYTVVTASIVSGLLEESGYNPPKKEYTIDTSMIISILSIEGENSNSIHRMIEKPTEAPVEPEDDLDLMGRRAYDFKLRGWNQKYALRYHNAKVISILELARIIEECSFELEFKNFQGFDYLTGINIIHTEHNYDFHHWEERLKSAVQKDDNGNYIQWWKRELGPWDQENFTDNERLLAWRIFNISVESVVFYYKVEYDTLRLVSPWWNKSH